MKDIELHALGQLDIGGDQSQPMRLFASGGLDIGDTALAGACLTLEQLCHCMPPVLISMALTLGWMSGRVKMIRSNPFSNAAVFTSMPSASTNARKNCRAAMPR